MGYLCKAIRSSKTFFVLLAVLFFDVGNPSLLRAGPSKAHGEAPPAEESSSSDFYVSPAGNDSNHCLSADSPCLSIGAALSKTRGGSGAKTIHLAVGNYSRVNGSFAGERMPITIQGHNALDTRIDARGEGGAVNLSDSASVFTLQDLAIVNGHGAETYTLGGGIYNNGTLNLIRVALMNNRANNGGGIYNTSSGRLKVEDSSISSNVAETDDLGNGNGAGIYNAGFLSLLNTTLSFNWAAGGGGGLYAVAGSRNKLAFTTVSVNAANAQRTTTGRGAGIYLEREASLDLKNSLVASNANGTGSPTTPTTEWGDCNIAPLLAAGPSQTEIINLGTNFIAADACHFPPEAGIVGSPTSPEDAKLGLLFYNGGSTITQALLAESRVNTQVSGEDCNDLSAPPIPVTHDQRGVARPLGFSCSSGALQASPLLIPIYLAGTPPVEQPLATLNFGDVLVGTTSSQLVRIKNMGQFPLTLTPVLTPAGMFSASAVPLDPAHPGSAGVEACNNVLPTHSCFIRLDFSPSAVGAAITRLTFTGNNPAAFDSITAVNISANAVATADHLAPASASSGDETGGGAGAAAPTPTAATPSSGSDLAPTVAPAHPAQNSNTAAEVGTTPPESTDKSSSCSLALASSNSASVVWIFSPLLLLGLRLRGFAYRFLNLSS
ncbi:MAG: hypothetical protein HQM15_06795 [Deltaproteobacteria bacterium]|nr:hypothetical protein [Deltaproteobacteria bacterium]